MFAAGVGLGASKGAEIGKHPEGYAGYLSKGKDMVSAMGTGWGGGADGMTQARERYGKTD
jgi:hypothetical protein